ncbi:class I SAM-dependent methyltransferase [Flavihumibacter profundi]|uniref:class I SAM-dependent methyltransferase n=1 Tax=Flavihumibacter profundi TaxID=2716883 RepID=UPI001CC652FF|nr:hypothetical protein [Flavihumibacter profundi]MBZ5859281.1 hypothetical protein [Flavihumibacter profundi]
MALQLSLQTLQIGKTSVSLLVPDDQSVLEEYRKRFLENNQTPFPYWAKIWPASIALSVFLDKNPAYYAGSQVMELAAGLGLPSLVAARKAANVNCTDYMQEAVTVIQQSAQYNRLTNLQSSVLDWNVIPSEKKADVILLSDINYDPEDFKQLDRLVRTFLHLNMTVILSTPQRLMAKPFISGLMEYSSHQESIPVLQNSEEIFISVLVLKSISTHIGPG